MAFAILTGRHDPTDVSNWLVGDVVHVFVPLTSAVSSFVPAESATLGIVDKIFTRIQTRESVSKVVNSPEISAQLITHQSGSAHRFNLLL